jgi:formate-dependent nitrite reductase membrane component NrfD
MTELVTSRANPLVDPGLHVWGWEVALYLFLGGFVAGGMVLTGHVLLSGRHARRSCFCSVLPLLGVVLLSLGMLALFLDLEHKLHVVRFYLTIRPSSPMSWGAWILLLVSPVLLASALVKPPEWLMVLWPRGEAISRRLRARTRALHAIGWASALTGTALGVYTGILLSALGARPLWGSALLGPLFLVSGLSTAAAFGHLIAGDTWERAWLVRLDVALLGLELALLGLMLAGLRTGGAAHHEAAGLLLGGPFTAVFWVIVVGLGILLPLAIQSLAIRRRIAHAPIAPLLVLFGGLALRVVIVAAGQSSHWPRA